MTAAKVVYASAGAHAGDRAEVNTFVMSGALTIGLRVAEALSPIVGREAVILLTPDEAAELRDYLNEAIR